MQETYEGSRVCNLPNAEGSTTDLDTRFTGDGTSLRFNPVDLHFGSRAVHQISVELFDDDGLGGVVERYMVHAFVIIVVIIIVLGLCGCNVTDYHKQPKQRCKLSKKAHN